MWKMSTDQIFMQHRNILLFYGGCILGNVIYFIMPPQPLGHGSKKNNKIVYTAACFTF